MTDTPETPQGCKGFDWDECARCGRTAEIGGPANVADPYDYIHWEVFGPPEDCYSVCPGCVTPEEAQRIDQASMDLGAQMDACARCRRSFENADDHDGWELVFRHDPEGEHVCPRCLTDADRAEVAASDLAAAENLRLTWGSKDRLN